ncbi:MAG: 4'-phosphopantetheinyl transferase superfamily protein, partial [Candidatus Hydrogenedentes bacterium]|nr:4'-phosphopantetheinyl transferase superfamily protein [Candidatus Hydrogenedentota bacterium]
PERVRLTYNAQGRPELADETAPDGLRFNVSHSGALALVAATRGRAIGVDIEQVHERAAAMGIARRFFSREEVAALRALPAEARRVGFLNCWTRKEAYIKAKGQGLSLPLDKFSVTLAPGDPPALLRTQDDPAEAGRWALHAIDAGPGYVAAVAVEGHGLRIEVIDWGAA